MRDLSDPIFHDEAKARKHLEAQRWPEGPYCPHCGEADQDRITKLKGKSTRPGVYKCKSCRKPFSVTVGTAFERSHVPLHKWLLATRLLCSSKKGMSAHQLHRTLGVTYKTAWFMAHRIREAMIEDRSAPMGGDDGGSVQADETYFGKKEDQSPPASRKGRPYKQKTKGPAGKRAVVSLISGGKARTFHVRRADLQTVREILVTNVARSAALYTDESNLYKRVGSEFKSHETVKHSAGEYARGPVTTNAVENYFSVFKRGMKGVYQHCAEKHLQRYITEFDFRYNSRDLLDAERTDQALKGISGKRLTYRRTNEASFA